MLKKLHELRDSITGEQREIISERLSPEIIEALDAAFSSTTEDEAARRTDVFAQLLRKRPMKAFGLYRALDNQQKTIVMELMGD